MNKLILVEKGANGIGFKRYLTSEYSEFGCINIFEKKDVITNPQICAGVRYIFSTWNMPIFSETELRDFLPSLEAVFYAAGDASYFSPPFQKRGVKIFSAQRENSIPVAEFVLGQILLSNKGYFQAQETYRRGFWRLGFNKARASSQRKPGNVGATVGIIGLGNVGSLLADMLKPFDIKVVAHDPCVDDETARFLGVVKVSLEELFQTSDVISSHLPDTLETRGLIDYRFLSTMKPNATFINTGRGRQIDEAGLAKAMREVPSRSALLDVTCREPPDPFSPLYRTRNIFLSPHIAGSQGNEISRLYDAALRNYLSYRNI